MEHGPPCTMCRERLSNCTFTNGPGRRTRPNKGRLPEGGAQSRVDPSQSTRFDLNLIDSAHQDEFDAARRRSVSIRQPEYRNPQDIHHEDFDDRLDLNMDNLLDMFNYDIQESSHFAYLASPNPGLDLARRDVPGSSPPAQASPNSSAQESNSSRSDSSLANYLPSSIPGPSSVLPRNGVPVSIENNLGASSRFIGFTGELDLYLLRHRRYDVDNQSSSQHTNVVYRRMNQQACLRERSPTESNSIPPQVFSIMDDTHTRNAEPRADQEVLLDNEQTLRELISDDIARRLIRLYYRFVDPYFPILSRAECPPDGSASRTLSVSLLAAICATTIPFIIYDDDLCVQLPRAPSVTQLFRVSWLAITQELHTPRLSTIQACLLMLQRHPTDLYVADSPFQWTLMSITVAAAQNLGLNRDPTEWTAIPIWERRLRKRLWWAVWVMEKFTALGQGMPTHLIASNCDVDLLTAEDFVDDQSEGSEGDGTRSHFFHLMTLTIVLNDIVEIYYTVQSVKKTANNFQLSLGLAKQARAKLKDWIEQLPPNLRSGRKDSANATSAEGLARTIHQLDGNCSLRLAYIVTQMTLFRALLRPISSSSTPSSHEINQQDFGGAHAVITGAIACVKELVEFVESLTGVEWDAFWHSCKSSNRLL